MKNTDTRSTRGLLFPTNGEVTSVVLSPSKFALPEELDVSAFFPNGAISIRLTHFPPSWNKLNHDWRIFVSRCTEHAPKNNSIAKFFEHEWKGNIIMAKCPSDVARWQRMPYIMNSEQSIAKELLERYAYF